LSVAFDQVLIADPLSSKDTLLQAEQISLRFNPFDLWNGKYQIEQITSFNGQLNLKTDAKGQTNYDIFKDTSSSSSSFNLELETILLEQFEVAYRDQKSAQSYTSTIHSASLSGKFSAQKTTLKAEGDVWLKRIQKGRVVLLKNEPLVFELALLVDQTQNLIKLPQAQIKIANLPFLIDAEFGPVKSSLDIRSENLSLIQLVRTVQPASMAELKRVKAKGKVDFHLHYEDAIERETPLVQAYFNIENGQLTEPKFGAKIENLHCYGTYLNIDTDNLVIEQFKFDTGGAHFFGQLQLSNFLRPKLSIAAKGQVPLSLIQAIYPLANVQELGGTAQLDVHAKMVQDQQNNWQTNEIAGRIGIKAANVRFTAYQNAFRV
jgi:AsmA protein